MLAHPNTQAIPVIWETDSQNLENRTHICVHQIVFKSDFELCVSVCVITPTSSAFLSTVKINA